MTTIDQSPAIAGPLERVNSLAAAAAAAGLAGQTRELVAFLDDLSRATTDLVSWHAAYSPDLEGVTP